MPRFSCAHLDNDDSPCPVCNPKTYALLPEADRLALESVRKAELQPDAAKRERARLAQERADIAAARAEGKVWKPGQSDDKKKSAAAPHA